jgi:hypothetical protein
MRAKKRHSFLAIVLILVVGIPGSIGIFVAQAKAVVDQSGIRNQQQAATVTVTTTSTQQPPAVPSSTSTNLPLSAIPSLSAPGVLYAYIQAPSGTLSAPYVILKAFSSRPRGEAISIRGFVNAQEFICPGASCVLYLEGSSRFVFRAYSDDGRVSDEVIASVSVTPNTGRFRGHHRFSQSIYNLPKCLCECLGCV